MSAVILDPRYEDSGIRVVRTSRGTEYGHQNYYDRLGHVSVYTAESDQLEETAEQRRARRNEFFEVAGAHLKAGTNLILSPEGTSYWTEDSPGTFKPGAFRLAASVEPEPKIVPMAVANFDRRVHGEFNWSSQHLDDEVLRCRNGNGDGQTGRVGLRCVRLVGRR